MRLQFVVAALALPACSDSAGPVSEGDPHAGELAPTAECAMGDVTSADDARGEVAELARCLGYEARPDGVSCAASTRWYDGAELEVEPERGWTVGLERVFCDVIAFDADGHPAEGSFTFETRRHTVPVEPEGHMQGFVENRTGADCASPTGLVWPGASDVASAYEAFLGCLGYAPAAFEAHCWGPVTTGLAEMAPTGALALCRIDLLEDRRTFQANVALEVDQAR